MKFFLVGMPGCGKSTFGRRLSKSTGYKLIDLDIEIVSYAGKTISDIFESEGEQIMNIVRNTLLILRIYIKVFRSFFLLNRYGQPLRAQKPDTRFSNSVAWLAVCG